ncbi:MAG: YitT family protein [Leptospira sp.]|nr:YitT family protein [Leptospira sp.]
MSSYISHEQLFSRRWFRAYGLILIGAVSISLGYVLFIIPYKVLPGGVYGISIVLHHSFGFPVGLTALFFNIILLLTGLKLLGPMFGFKTLTALIVTSVMVDVMSYITKLKPLVADDALVSSIFGGLMVGLGVGLIFKSRASTGGSDVLAMILGKYSSVPVGQIMIGIDSVVVLIGLVAFQDWKIPLYSWILIFVYGKTVDFIIQGGNYDKTLFIISEKYELITKHLYYDMGRNVTFINGENAPETNDQKIIFTTVSRREVALLQDYIHSVDPNAFMTVLEASEVVGSGFMSLQEKLNK